MHFNESGAHGRDRLLTQDFTAHRIGVKMFVWCSAFELQAFLD